MRAESRPRRVDLTAQELAGETLVYLPDGGVCTLNLAAREVWELCDGTRTQQEIADDFAALHPDEDRDALRRDAIAAVFHLQHGGLLELPGLE
jgi:hypothetical protein